MLSKSTQRKLALYFCAMIILHGYVLWQATQSIRQALPDFSTFYTAGRIVRAGQGDRLYDDTLQDSLQRSFLPQAVQRRGAILPYNHPPFEAVLFVPLAGYSYLAAYKIWLAVNLVLLGSIPFLLRKRLQALGKVPLYLWLLACFAFYPLFIAVIQGQDSILLLLLYCLAWRSLERGRDSGAGGFLAAGLFKYQLVLPFVVAFLRRKKLIAGLVAVAIVPFLISVAVAGWSGLLAYPGYVWGIEHDMKYSFNTLPGVTPNLRGLISGIVPLSNTVMMVGATIFLSAFVVLAMIYAAGRVSPANRESQRVLFALSLVGMVLVSYHLYVHDLSLLFLSIILTFEILLSNPPASKWMRTTLYVCIALLFCSPLYLMLTLYYPQLRLMAIVLIVFFVALLSMINSLRGKTGETVSPPASADR